MSEGLAARRAALDALAAVEERGTWSNLAVPEAVGGLEQDRDRAFASHLAYDTLRWQGTLDWALSHHLRRPPAEVEPALRRVLRLGALQLLRTSVPDRAAVATSVSLAREAVPAGRARGAGGFVNGVLRSLAREREQLPWPDADRDPVAHLALATAHPEWVAAELLERFGAERAAAILEADNRSPGVTLRATGDAGALLDELAAEGIEARAGRVTGAVRAPGADPRRLAAVAEGRAVVQDEASQHVGLRAGVAPGDRVLDLCAGPGGKTTHLAAQAGPAGHVVAVELREHRARLVRRAARTVGVDVDVRVGDALEPPLAEEERFDVVLLDAPCTGLGTGRRRPEIRWRVGPRDARELAALQHRLLRVATERVAPGGRLTYSVCTWTHAETVEVAEAFDRAAADGWRAGDREQLLGDVDDTDGMFVTRWDRQPPGRVAARR